MIRLLTGGQDLMRNAGPICGHEALSLHRPNRDDRLIGPLVAHDADRPGRESYGKDLVRASVKVGGDDLFKQNLITLPKQVHTM